MKKSKLTVSTSEVASKLDVTRAAVTQWCRQGLFRGAFVEETARGPVWHIPQDDLKTFKPPKTGRPRRTDSKKKRPAKRARKKSRGPKER